MAKKEAPKVVKSISKPGSKTDKKAEKKVKATEKKVEKKADKKSDKKPLLKETKKAVKVSPKPATKAVAKPMLKTDLKAPKGAPKPNLKAAKHENVVATHHELVGADVKSVVVQSGKPGKEAKPPKQAKVPKVKPERKTKAKLAAEKVQVDDLKKWADYKNKYGDDKAQPYSMSGVFEAGTAILHKVLGWGFIIQVQNDRLEVLFETGSKVLISNYKP